MDEFINEIKERQEKLEKHIDVMTLSMIEMDAIVKDKNLNDAEKISKIRKILDESIAPF